MMPQLRAQQKRYRPLLVVGSAAAAGIVLDRWCGMVLGLVVWWTLAAALAIGCHFLLRWNRSTWAAFTLLTSIIALGGMWRHYWWSVLDEHHLARYALETSEPTCVEAIVVDRVWWTPAPPPDPLSVLPAVSRTETMVQVVRIRDGADWLPAVGICPLRVDGELRDVQRGDRLRVFGQFSKPLAALNPGQFDWSQYQRSQGRFVDLYAQAAACVTVIKPHDPSVGNWLHSARYWCEHQISKYFGPAQKDLELTLLLGSRTQTDEAVYDAFLRTGTVHLLVVSGLHVAFLAGLVWLLVRSDLMPQRWGIAVSALVVLVYTAIVGGQSPVMRSTVLVLLGLWLLAVGRRPSMANLLAVAGLVVLAWNPSELFRGGTQLSFVCVAILSWYAKVMLDVRRVDPLTRLIREAENIPRKLVRWVTNWSVTMLVASLIIFLATVPLVAYHFQNVAPVSVVLTPLVWPLVAIALVTGFAICTFGWLAPPIAYFLGWIGSRAVEVTTWVVQYADSLSAGHFYWGGPPVWWLVVFYGVLALLALLHGRIDWKWQVATLALWIAAGIGSAGIARAADSLECTFLAVGHGTCVVLELPGGQTILYDAGSLGSPESASKTIASFLLSRGITRVDAVVLSHADVDHYNAMPGLVERFPIGKVFVSPLMFDPWATSGQLSAPNYLRETLAARGVPLEEVWMNDRLQTSNADVSIDVLHPPRTGVAGRDNANSILLHVCYAGRSILLPGDLESPGIERVMADPPVDCDILLAPHHGSANSDPPGFADWCDPEWVVVSGGDSVAAAEFTAKTYRDKGAQVLQTAHLGATHFSIAPDQVKVAAFRDGWGTE